MEGYQGAPPSHIIPRFWAHGWNSGQAINKMQPGPDQPLPGGDVGVRLIEPAENLRTPHFLELPMAFTPSGVEDLVVPVHHIFGSEEMSNHAPGIAECAPAPYVGLNPSDAREFGLNDGDLASIETYGVSLSLPVKVMPILVPGVAVLPVGLRGLEGVLPPFYARIQRAAGELGERPDLARIREAAAVAWGPDAGTTAENLDRGPAAHPHSTPGTEAGDAIG
jgi:NADH-quinone oxidoreductase subunit G